MSLAAAIAASSLSKRYGRDRTEDLLAQEPRVAADAGQHGRLVEVARAVARLPPSTAWAPLPIASRDQLVDLVALGGVDQRADLDVRPRCRGRPSCRAASRPASRRTRPARWWATWKRLAAVHASPMLRILAITAPSTAASTSASAKTRNGALPPSSIDVRSRPSADCSTSFRPTSVEPVNVSLRSRGSAMIGAKTWLDDDDGDHVQHAAGQPGLVEDLGQREHRERRLLRRLDHHRAAGRNGRADLARAHRHREVPRRDRVARADRLAHRDQPALAVRRRREATLDPHRLLGEPAEELRGVGDLRLRLRDRLAHLERHDQRQLVGARGDLLPRAAQDLAALARRVRGPLGLHRDARVERRRRVLGRGVGDLGEASRRSMGPRRRGSRRRSRRATRRR